MYICGIVCEYNPFHLGHRYQIECVKRALGDGETGIVCVMSGDFVQRGSAAVFDKFARAEAAVRCGVSLVLELPLLELPPEVLPPEVLPLVVFICT